MHLFAQLSLGSLIIIVTVVVHGTMMQELTKLLHRRGPVLIDKHGRRGELLITMTAVLWILVAHTIEIWLWALLLIGSGAFVHLEEAIYFALSSFTTLGYGDIVLGPDHRVLGAMSAANGLLIFGWSTAVLVGLVGQIVQSQIDLEGGKRKTTKIGAGGPSRPSHG